METVVYTIVTMMVGVMLGFSLNWATIQYLRRRIRELHGAVQDGRKPAKPETMKRVVWVCVINGFAWVWCSYVLAALDKAQIAEELSKVALAEIIVPVAVYALKSVVENLSKNNRWPDKGDTAVEADPPDGEEGM